MFALYLRGNNIRTIIALDFYIQFQLTVYRQRFFQEVQYLNYHNFLLDGQHIKQ